MESLHSLSFHAVALPNSASGLSVLHAICIEGDVKMVKFLLDVSPSVVDLLMILDVPVLNSSPSEYKGEKLKDILELLNTPSHKSIQELLIHRCQGLDKWPLLHVAARKGNVQHINKLISQGFSLSHSDAESRDLPMALHVAAEHNSVEVVKELLHHGACLHAKNRGGFSAIHFAAKAGQRETVSFLLDRDISLRDAAGSWSHTPLHLAAWEGQTEIATLLVARGADINAGEKGITYEGIHTFFKSYSDFCGGVADNNGELTKCESNVTPILLAARQGHLEIFELLEQHGGLVDGPVLFLAVKGGNVALLKKLVDAGHNTERLDEEGRTLLHFAISIEQAKFLIALGFDVNSKDNNGETPLHHAAHIGNIKLADLLIEHGASVSAKCVRGHTPLVFAVTGRKRSPDVVSYFAQKLMHCGKKNISCDLALHFSGYFSPEVARILLDVGLSVNKRSRGNMPLHSAVWGDPETVRLLVENGAKIDARDYFGETPFQLAAKRGKPETLRILLLKKPNLIKAVDWRKRNALYWACSWGNAKCTQFLLDHGCKLDIKAVDKEGNNALQNVVMLNHDDSYVNIAEALLEHAANVGMKEKVLNAVNKKGQTALHSAVVWENIFMVQLLLKYGFAVDAIDKTGKTPLYQCRISVQVCKVLLEAGADLALTDKKGNTPLHNACKSFNYSTVIVEFLLDQRPVDVHSRNEEGKTPLHIIVGSLQYEKTKMLLDRGADVNAVDSNGCTPLHLAAKNRFYPTVFQLLVEQGANVNAVDKEGNTPLHVAACKTELSEALVSFLIDHGGDATIANKKGKTPNGLLELRNTNSSHRLRRFASGIMQRMSRR